MPDATPCTSTSYVPISKIQKEDNNQQPDKKLHIIEWNHMSMAKFYPMALASSWTIRGILYPLNVVKARLQLQKQNLAYRNTFHAFSEICSTEGTRALFRGFWVTLPQIFGSFIYSTIYEKTRSELHSTMRNGSAQLISSMAGGTASIFTQFIFVPTDVISQYLIICNNPKHFSGGAKNAAVLDYLRNDHKNGDSRRLTLGLRVAMAIYKIDGFRGFYRGFIPSALLYGLHAACFWSAYYTWLDIFKKIWINWSISRMESGQTKTIPGDVKGLLALQCVSGGLGGATAAFCTNSLEVFRLRIQVHRMGYVETIKRLRMEEGFRTFTKGLGPRMINNGLQSLLIMTVYEALKRLCVLPEYRDSIVW